jgi:AbrB family looped-hinge helix DNA binding protein
MATKPPTSARERIGRVGQRRQVVIPLEIFDKLQMREGDFVVFSQEGNGVLLKPKRAVDPDDVLSPDEAKRLRRSLKHTRAGKTRPWPQIKHELGL